MLTQGARNATIFDHAELDYNPLGHPPTDGKQGGYGVAHFDVHFFAKPYDRDARARIRLAPSYDAAGARNATAVASAAAASTAAFLAPPAAGVMPPESELVLDPESVVPTQARIDARCCACIVSAALTPRAAAQGVHWVPATDWQQVYRDATHTGVLGTWSGNSYMVGTFNGTVTFLEIMISLSKLGELAAGRQSRSEEAPVPQPAGGAAAIKEARRPAHATASACSAAADTRVRRRAARVGAQVWGDALFPSRYFVSYDNATDDFAVGWRFDGGGASADGGGAAR